MTHADSMLPVTKRSAYIAPMAPGILMTADELLALRFPDKRMELIRGRLVVREPAGFRHGAIAAALTRRLVDFVNRHQLGGGRGRGNGIQDHEQPGHGPRAGCRIRARRASSESTA